MATVEPGKLQRPEAEKLKVFISYSRHDAAFANEIAAGLSYNDEFEVFIDTQAISEGEDWKARLGALIASVDTVIFILTAKSAASPVCRWEVEEAERLHKRVLPVQATALGSERPPSQLASLNYVRFDPLDNGMPRSFMGGLAALRRALNTDVAWLREHTRLLTRAREWEAAGRADNRLLSGDDIRLARQWLDAQPLEAISPTELHRDYIAASGQAESRRIQLEQERVRQLQAALEEAEQARRTAESERKAAEQARVDQAASSRKVVHRTVAGLVVSLVLMAAAGISGFLAYQNQQSAVFFAGESEQARRLAEQSRQEAVRRRNDAVAALSQSYRATGEVGKALALAWMATTKDGTSERDPDAAPASLGALMDARDSLAERRVLRGHASRITGLAFAPGGESIYAASIKDGVKRWNVASGKLEQTVVGDMPGLTGFALSPDGLTVFVGTEKGEARLVDVRTGATITISERDNTQIGAATFLPDGRSIALGSGTVGERRGEVRVLDAHSGRQLAAWSGRSGITSLAVSADGERIAFGSYDSSIGLWRWKSDGEPQLFERLGQIVSSVALSADGRLLASASFDRTARVWGTSGGQALHIMQGHEDFVVSIAFNPDGRMLLTGSSDGSARIWDAATGAELGVFRAQGKSIIRAAFLGDGRTFATGDEDGTVRTWEARLGLEQAVFPFSPGYHRLVAISRDGARLVTGSWDSFVVREYPSLRQTLLFERPSSFSRFVFPGNAANLIASTFRGEIVELDLEGQKVRRLIKAHDNAVDAIDVSADGRFILTGSRDTTAALWDFQSGTKLREFKHDHWVNAVALSPDGERVLTASGAVSEGKGQALLWDRESGRLLQTLTGHDRRVLTVAFSPDGGTAITGSSDGTARIWDLQSGGEIRRLEGHTAAVWRAVFTPDGKYVLTAGDRTARLWEAKSGSLVRIFKGHVGILHDLDVHPKGGAIVTGGDNSFRVWRHWTDLDQLHRESLELLTELRPLTTAECERMRIADKRLCAERE